MTRYLSGLCVAGLGLCGGGWLVVAAVAFGGLDGGDAVRVNLATGAGLIVVGCVTAVAWAMAWRRRMRADGVLGMRFAAVSRRQARRNRRELTRDVRRAARSAKASAREARRRARRVPRLADGGLADIGLAGGGLGGSGLGGGGLGGGMLADSGLPGSGLSGGGLGEPRGWIGGGRTGYAPHGPARAGQGQAAPGTVEVLVELRTLRALLTPLLEAAAREPATPPAGEPAPPPLPQRRPGEERPGIPRQRTEQAKQAGQAQQAGQPEQADQDEQADQPEQAGQDQQPASEAASEAAGPAAGLVAGEGELLRLADSEEAWW